MHVIYGLQDPRDRLFFYVGQTEDVYKRFVEHIQCSGNNYEKNAKITKMRGQNVLPLMVELQRTEDAGVARVREAYWINHYASLGHPMTNIVRSAPKIVGKVLVRSKAVQSSKKAIKDTEKALGASKPLDITSTKAQKYRFNVEERERIIELYRAYNNIDKVFGHMKRGARWHRHASEILKEAGLL